MLVDDVHATGAGPTQPHPSVFASESSKHPKFRFVKFQFIQMDVVGKGSFSCRATVGDSFECHQDPTIPSDLHT